MWMKMWRNKNFHIAYGTINVMNTMEKNLAESGKAKKAYFWTNNYIYIYIF